MNPSEHPKTFRFLESVYQGEKEALENEIIALSRANQKGAKTDFDINERTKDLERRLAFITKYWENNKSHHPLIFEEDGKPKIACPRCLAHEGHLQHISVLMFYEPGEMELLCKRCNLHHDATKFSPIPPPTVQ